MGRCRGTVPRPAIREVNMKIDLSVLVYVFYILGSLFFLAGSVLSIVLKLAAR